MPIVIEESPPGADAPPVGGTPGAAAVGDGVGDGVDDALGCGCLQSAINFADGLAVRGGALDCAGRLLATRP